MKNSRIGTVQETFNKDSNAERKKFSMILIC